jgi:hypothetical protein
LAYVLITLRVMMANNRLEIDQILAVLVHNHHAERDEYILSGTSRMPVSGTIGADSS